MRNPRANGPNLGMQVPLDSQKPREPIYFYGILVRDDSHLHELIVAQRVGNNAGYAYRAALAKSEQDERQAHLQRWLAAGGTLNGFLLQRFASA